MTKTSPSCLIIAGEKSGEEHAMTFVPALKQAFPDLELWGVGGDALKQEGMKLFYHLEQFSSWGYSEVISKIPFYFQALKKIENEVVARNCKVAILIDFQSFNMKLASRLKRRGVKILYYVAPQAWAWKSYRAKTIAKSVDHLFTIIPFEKRWFSDRGVSQVESVSHPVWLRFKDEFSDDVFNLKKKDLSQGPIKLLLLPGSRNFEVQKLLPTFIEAVKVYKHKRDVEVSIVVSPNVKRDLYHIGDEIYDQVFQDHELSNALKQSDLAIAASGTVTLTSALFCLPTIVCYKSSLLNQFIFETFVNYKGHISLANIVHEKEVFPEFIQDRVSLHNILKVLDKWTSEADSYAEVVSTLKATKDLINPDPHIFIETLKEIIGDEYDRVCK